MIRISFEADIRKLRRDVADIREKQIPFATVLALNEVAGEAQRQMRQRMERDFDRPTPYTLTATWVRRANKQNLRAEVMLKDESFKAAPATKWLAPEVEGGQRPLKRHEFALRRANVLPEGMFAVPGEGAQMDAFGNMSKGQIVQILAWFRAFHYSGYRMNMTDKGRAKLSKGSSARAKRYRPPTSYFVVSTGGRGRLKPGVYMRQGQAHDARILPVLRFVRRPGYRKRLPFYETVDVTAKREFAAAFQRGMAQAMATARS